MKSIFKVLIIVLIVAAVFPTTFVILGHVSPLPTIPTYTSLTSQSTTALSTSPPSSSGVQGMVYSGSITYSFTDHDSAFLGNESGPLQGYSTAFGADVTAQSISDAGHFTAWAYKPP